MVEGWRGGNQQRRCRGGEELETWVKIRNALCIARWVTLRGTARAPPPDTPTRDASPRRPTPLQLASSSSLSLRPAPLSTVDTPVEDHWPEVHRAQSAPSTFPSQSFSFCSPARHRRHSYPAIFTSSVKIDALGFSKALGRWHGPVGSFSCGATARPAGMDLLWCIHPSYLPILML